MAAVSAFREMFPEFSSQVNYPSSQIQVWMDVAAKMVNEARWGALTDFGVYLCTAHHLAMSTRSVRDAAFGKAPGQTSGVLTSKSIDGVSASYDASVATVKDAGHWNLTQYGVQFKQQAQLMGAGPVSVEGAVNTTSVSAAWPGPPISNW